MANAEALQAFVLHAQRAGAIDVAFLEQSFAGPVRGQVPTSPPVVTSELTLADAGGGVVNASCPLGQNADRYAFKGGYGLPLFPTGRLRIFVVQACANLGKGQVVFVTALLSNNRGYTILYYPQENKNTLDRAEESTQTGQRIHLTLMLPNLIMVPPPHQLGR